MATAIASCSTTPVTELVVVVDTDFTIPSELDAIHIVVTRPDGTMADELEMLADRRDLPLTLGVVTQGETLGPIEVAAEGRHGGTRVVSRSATVTLVRSETRVLVMHLVRACVGVTCASGQTCTERGCESTMASSLPPWTGRPPSLDSDAGPLDGGIRDAGRDAPAPDTGPCASAAECDDGNPCTDDTCAGGCVHANNANACDDRVFCNGVDVCAGGSCAHSGDPCTAPTTCAEATDACLGCTTRAQCPADVVGAFNACDYADGCVETGTHQRVDITYACISSSCVATPSTVMMPCTRTTDGDSCGATSCGSFGACSYAATCSTSGTMTQTCTDLTCASGVCHPAMRAASAPCTRMTDGTSCGATSCMAWGACEWSATCAETATRHRSCTDPVCVSASCGGPPRMEADTTTCVRDTDGTSCGASQACVAGACTSCTPSFTGGHTSSIRTVTASGHTLTFVDAGAPATMGTVVASSTVTFTGGATTASSIIGAIHAAGHTITFFDIAGVNVGTVTVTGASVSGDFAPPCIPFMSGCIPGFATSVTTSGSSIVLHANGGSMTSLVFTCP